MEIIALTNGGALIEATENEIKEIQRAVSGESTSRIKVGMKLPAVDYANTVRRVKDLKENSQYKTLMSYGESFVKTLAGLKEEVESASKLEIKD